jgi:hypothetical protein
MGTGAREVWLRDEIARLGRAIDASPDDLVGFDASVDMGMPYIQVEPGGPYHWIVKERGKTYDHRTTLDVDEILYWSFVTTTSSMASAWAAQHPDEGRDFRVGMWAKQQELLSTLDPAWALRWRERLMREVPGAEALLPTR